MSYILDALKKAEAQRTLGALPNIHAAAVFAAAPGERAPLWRRAARWGALAALAATLIALAWLRPWRPVTMLPQARPSAPVVAAAPAPPIVPAVPVTVAPQAVPPKASKPRVATASAARPQPRPAAVAATPAKKPLPTAASSAAAPEPKLQTLRELPPQIQREIPPLVISGYIYSSIRAERSLLINNQLLREGDTVAPGLVLEQMLRGAVVLNYQGYRYRMPY